jgi:CelD/BcsL family acetyltransferase involved in cellulose biosynthesis
MVATNPAFAPAVRRVDGAAGVLELARPWDDLMSRAPSATPFVSRAWLEPWLETAHVRGTPTAIAAWSGGRLDALLVLAIRRAAGLWVAEPPGSELPSYHGVVSDPAHPDAVARIADHCASERVFDLLTLSDLEEGDSATDAFLARLARNGYDTTRVLRNVCHSIEFGGCYETFLRERKSKKSLKNLRQEERRLLESGDVRLEHFVGPEITVEAMRRAARVQAESWSERRGAARLSSPFYERLALSGARGCTAHLWLLVIDGEDAAFGYALAANARMHYVWTAFRLRHRRRSVGKILTHWIIRDACRSGMTSFDFGHGDAEYKRFWSTRSRPVRRVVAARGKLGPIAAGGIGLAWRIARIEPVRTAWRRLRRICRAGERRREAAHAAAPHVPKVRPGEAHI